MLRMVALSRTIFGAYLLLLLWLVLFKLSYDIVGIVRDFQTQSVNLIPFAYAKKAEVIANIVAFVPFGVMLGLNFKEVAFRYKLAAMIAFSLAVEVVQYALAIGVTDITDLMMNTLGGFLGLVVYTALNKHTADDYLDRTIVAAGTVILLAGLYLRIFVFIVKY